MIGKHDVWYFAYGSNLDVDQKQMRTGAIRQAYRARLNGFRLTFNKRSGDGTSKANICSDENSSVWGVVYLCSPAALSKMDRNEGVGSGHYARFQVSIVLDDGTAVDALTYVAGDDWLVESLPPSDDYLSRILKGAEYHGLPEDYIKNIASAAHSGH